MDDANRLARRLGYIFNDVALLKQALTHRSKGVNNNERLEFLGDSILNFVIAAELYDRFIQLTEGELTRLRASLVKKEALAELARELELGNYLELGSGEYKSGGHDRDSILSDALEAVFGAIYKDGGFDVAREVILRVYHAALTRVDPHTIGKDPKTLLQEFLQKQSLKTPLYVLLETAGEAHQQNFTIECQVPDLKIAVKGQGSSRRNAEQHAASKALEIISGG